MPDPKKPEEQKPAPDLLEDLKAKNDASDKLVDDIVTADRLLLKNLKALGDLKKKNRNT